jgi:cold-inducible RNA-binding protein
MSKLYVGNLNWNTSEAALAEHFRQYGDVVEAKIMTDRETGRSRGFGFVTMATSEEAMTVQEKLDGRELDGRPLRVNEAHDKDDRRGGQGRGPRREWQDDRGGGKKDRRSNGRRGRDY